MQTAAQNNKTSDMISSPKYLLPKLQVIPKPNTVKPAPQHDHYNCLSIRAIMADLAQKEKKIVLPFPPTAPVLFLTTSVKTHLVYNGTIFG